MFSFLYLPFISFYFVFYSVAVCLLCVRFSVLLICKCVYRTRIIKFPSFQNRTAMGIFLFAFSTKPLDGVSGMRRNGKSNKKSISGMQHTLTLACDKMNSSFQTKFVNINAISSLPSRSDKKLVGIDWQCNGSNYFRHQI